MAGEELVAAEVSEVAAVEGAAGPTALGIGASILAPRALPVLGRILRPLAKGMIKAGLVLYDEASAAVSEARATVSKATGDLVAEARAEREREKEERRSSGTPAEASSTRVSLGHYG